MGTDNRKVAYEIDDVVLAEPFKVYKSANAWWMGFIVCFTEDI